MARFLSTQWRQQASDCAHLHQTRSDLSLGIRQQVPDGPDGPVDYILRLEHGRLSLESGDGPYDVSVMQSYATASAINRGEMTPASAFARGLLRLGGRIGLLVEHRRDLAELGCVFEALRSTTTYS